ncbi:unnamed protein product, partial [Didymodactylos carnosus]
EMSAQNSYTHTVYVHATDYCVQDNESVVAILQDVLIRVKADDPSIEYVYCRADNAGLPFCRYNPVFTTVI